MHDNSVLAFRAHGAPFIAPGDRVLEIAPDRDPSSYRLVCDPALRMSWETAELQSEIGKWADDHAPDVVMTSEYTIPVPSESYDVVLSGQVVEHVRSIWRWMGEVARVTKVGGHVVTVSPISWPYHEAPADCWRIYPEGMRALCDEVGLEIKHIWWGSLEAPRRRGTYPGMGRVSSDRSVRNRVRMFGRRIQGAVAFPNPVAYDMVTVARRVET